MTSLHLKLLGPPQLLLDDKPLSEFTYQKSVALLSYLVVTNETLSRSALATLLWGESSEANARAQLRTALAELRQHLAPYLEISRKAVAFNRNSDYRLDVDTFVAACESGRTDSQADINALKTAIDLYRGDFLQGFYVRNAVDFEQWQREQQEWLHKLAEQALFTIVDDCLARCTDDTLTEGLDYVNRLLTLTPWYEKAHRQKMHLLALKGQRSEALAQHQRCAQILAEQFGAEPDAETTALWEQIKAGQIKTVGKRQKIIAPTPPHNLPAPVITFIGREQELAEITGLLLDPEHRFITLVGEGGVGKTHLAQVAARQVLAHFPDGVWFVPLLNLQPPEATTPDMLPNMLASAIADALRITFSGYESPQSQLFDHLRRKKALLILDNFEHLLAGADFIVDLLKNAPEISILVTSRARLKFRTEYALRLDGLPVPPANDTPDAVNYNSIQLFIDRARRISGSFSVDDDNLPQLIQLCRFVEGLPLGIELISAWVEHLSLPEIMSNLQQSSDFLAATYQDVPERHHCLRVVFEHSWQLLSLVEQQLLAALSVFRGDFSRDAALTVIQTELSPLTTLVDKSLLQSTQPGRYALHELLRQFAAEKIPALLPATAQDEISERHSAYYLALVNRQTPVLYSNEPEPAVDELQAEMANIRQAWEWGAGLHFSPEVNQDYVEYKMLLMAQCVKGLIRLYDFKGLYQEAELIFRLAVERVRARLASPETDRAKSILFFRVLGAQGQFLLVLGDAAQAVTVIKEALAVTEWVEPDAEIQVHQLALFKCLGDGYTALSDFRGALDAYNQSLDIALKLSDKPGLAAARQSLAWIAVQQGQLDTAESQAQEALRLYRELGIQKDIAFTLNVLGTIAIRSGQYGQAETYYEQSLQLRRQLGNPREIVQSLNNLGTLLSETGKMDRAQQCYEECLSILQESGYRAGIANVLNNLGTLFAKQGQYERAQQYFEQSLQLRREIGDQYGAATSLNNLGAIARYLGDYETAQTYVEESLAIHIEIAHRPGSVYCLDNLGYITAARGNLTAAWRYFRMALEESLAVKAIILTLDALTGIAGLLAQSGDYARAAQLLSLTLNHPVVQAETHTNAEPILETLRQALPPDRLAAEMECGKSLDLQQVVTEVLRNEN